MIGRLEDVYLKAPFSKITFSALRTFSVSLLLKESALLDFLLLHSKRPLSLGSQVESFSLFSTSLTRSVPKDSQPPASLPGVQSLLINAFRSVHLEIFSSSSLPYPNVTSTFQGPSVCAHYLFFVVNHAKT